MSILDIIIFLFFTGGVVVFGCSFFNKKRSSEEFTSAGRSLPGWVVGMSIFATYVSSISYLAYPGKAYMSDWNAFVFSLSIPIASYFAAKYFVPFYRSIGSVSAYSFLEERFGPWARVYASSCYLLTQVARMGSILYLLALPMNALLGWDIKMIIAVTSVAIIAYSMLGGLKAVIWTEAIQGFILIGGAIACLCVLMFKMPERAYAGISDSHYRPEIQFREFRQQLDRVYFLGMPYLRYIYQSTELWYRSELRTALSDGKE